LISDGCARAIGLTILVVALAFACLQPADENPTGDASTFSGWRPE
jgi:hypothetical protein